MQSTDITAVMDDINLDEIDDEEINKLLRSSTKQRLVSLLSKASESGGGNFTCGGPLDREYKMPGIEVLCNSAPSSTTTPKNINRSEYKPIRLPIITKNQANEIIQYFEKAPFGKGEKTIFDDNVRKTWQLSPSQFRITNQHWNQYIDKLVENQVKPGLGIHSSVIVKHSLYKLLLYEEGDHFDFHRDTEKEDKMFATLVVQLPSLYSGGEIIVQHASSEETYDLAKQSSSTPFFFSFYCDCEHKVSKLTSGYRICLVYNVCYASGIRPTVVDRSLHFENLTSIVDNWDNETPFICYLLEHKYSEEGLKYDCLKGRDSNIMQILQQYNAKYDKIGIKLGMMMKTQDGGSGYDNFWTDPDFSIKYTVDEQGNQETKKRFKIPKSIIIPENILENLTVSKSEFEGHTGNAGARATRWYNSACILICPNRFKHLLAVEIGESASVKELENLFIQYEQDSSLKETIVEFIKKLLKTKVMSRTNLTKYVIKLNSTELVKYLLTLSRSGNNLNVESLVAVTNHFGLETYRGQVLTLLLNCNISLALGFLQQVVDQKMAEKVISAFSEKIVPSSYEGLVLLCQQYKKNLSDNVRNQILLKWYGDIKDLYEMAQRLKDRLVYQAVLDKFFRPLKVESKSIRVRQMSEYKMDANMVVNCIQNLGLNNCSKFLNEIIAEFCENSIESEIVKTLRMYSSYTTNDHVVQFMIEALCSGLSEKVTAESVDQLVEILKDIETRGIEFIEAFAKGLTPSKENKKNYHLVIYPIITKVKEITSIINTKPIQKLISQCISYYGKIIEKPKLVPPPSNWSMDITLQCTCNYCKEATEFLQNPKVTEYKLQDVEKVRKHVTDSIVNVTRDLEYETLKPLRPPHILQINKNPQSKSMQKKALEEVISNKKELSNLLSDIEPLQKKLKSEE